MTALLNSSTSWCQSSVDDSISSTGVVSEQIDSLVLVPISALRAANAKMIELKYEKEINAELSKIIHNDSIVIVTYETRLRNENELHKREVKKVKKERNAACIGGVAFFALSVLMLLK